MSKEHDVRIIIPKQYFKLRGPLVTATHVQVIIDGFVNRVDSVRVNSTAHEKELSDVLTGDPGIDRVTYLAYGALSGLGYSMKEVQITLNSAEEYKARVYGVVEKPVDTSEQVQ